MGTGIQYTPLVNGLAYSWSNVIVNVLGRTLIGIDAIDYEEKQDMSDNWGAGVYPVSRGFGNRKATCKITLYQEEVIALEQLSSYWKYSRYSNV